MAQWIALAVTVSGLLISIASIGKRYGYIEARLKHMADEMERSFKYHGEHFQHAKDDQAHFQNMEIHWTSRERDGLNDRLDKQDEKAEEILDAVRSLGRINKNNH